MVKNINLLLLRRMFALWLLASLVAGGVVFYIEMEKVDEQVRDLGMSGAYAIDQHVIEQIPELEQTSLADLETLVSSLIAGDFVIIEVYDKEQKHLAAAVRHDSEKADRILEKKAHQFPLDSANHYEKFYIDQNLYIQVLVPLRNKSDQVRGYFEGVYRVDEKTLSDIESHVYSTLALVLSVILATFVMIYPVILHLNRQLLSFSTDLFKANIELLEVMGSAVAKRDSTTDCHNYRVTLYAVRLGEALDLNAVEMSKLIAGAFLHDVGKIGIEDSILLKPGKLTDQEFSRMKEHVTIGVDIIAKAEWLHGARDVIEFHHEKYDGNGYMRGLNGEEIPLPARIFAIVDVFDALTSERPYKEALPLDEVMAIMARERGTHFDPQLLDLFISMAPSLYQNIGKSSYPALTRTLSLSVQRYFFNARMQ